MLSNKALAYVTPTHLLGREFYQELLKLLPAEIIQSDNQTDRKIVLKTGGSIKFFSGEALDQFRGNKFHYVIIDEAAFIPDLKAAWKAIRPTLMFYQGSSIWISTPNGKDFFYQQYLRGKNKEKDWESFHFSSLDNPTLSKEEFASLIADLTQAEYNQEILALAGENSANPFGSDNVNKNIIQELSTDPVVVYGIDLAKSIDFTVITGLDREGRMAYFHRFQKGHIETMEVIQKLPGSVLKVIDSTGAGDVYLETLSRSCENLIGYQFNESSKRELIKELILNVEKGTIKYNDTTAEEMHVCEYVKSPSGHYKFGARSGFHDDTVIALALANKFRNRALENEDYELYFA